MLTIYFSINRKPNEAIYQNRKRETMSSDIQIKPGKAVIVVLVAVMPYSSRPHKV